MSKKRQRNREKRAARRKPFRQPRPLILIVCEGQVTEKEYFVGFKNACHNPRVEIEFHPDQGVPKTLVEMARERKKRAERDAKREGDDNIAFDEVWCVFDIDEHPNIPDAVQMARDNGILLAISNPAIELWLLLHFRDHPGMKGRRQVGKLLKAFDTNYDKHVDYHGKYSDGYSDACRRAEKLEDTATIVTGEIHEHNPSTGVYKLTESIRGDSDLDEGSK
jgi:hypothetical protein